jgi:acetyl-CoA carboxylase biotin carboxyl carrier protein
MIDQDIYDLMGRFEKSNLTELKLTTQKFTLELSKAGGPAPVLQQPQPQPVPEAPEEEKHLVTAPLVGTFYAAPAPDQAAYVAVGDRVKEGQTLCLLEAMKMMSEIKAPCDCVIEEVLKENGSLAAFGDPLLRYTPC